MKYTDSTKPNKVMFLNFLPILVRIFLEYLEIYVVRKILEIE